MSERMSMVWPEGLKARVKEKVGPRGMTEFVVEATEAALVGGSGEQLKDATRELNETKHLVQLLADRLAMGGDHQDRHEALMEIDLPPWIETAGWPAEYAKLVRVQISEPAESAPVVEPDLPKPPDKVDEPPADPVPTPETPVDIAPRPPKPPITQEEDAQPAAAPSSSSRDDLFARVMARTGGKLDSGFANLKVASEIEPPEPQPMKDLCPTCNEELVDGECWTCD